MQSGHWQWRVSLGAGALSVLMLLATSVLAQPPGFAERPESIGGRPNLNGIWQAVTTANWNVEGQSAEAIPEFWNLGALFAVPPGQSVVDGGTIPYRPEALARRDANRAGWPGVDPEARCFRAGLPRQTYLPYPFEIIQGDGDIQFIYEYAMSDRTVRMGDNHLSPDEVLVDQWLGWANGHWEGDTLVVSVFGQMPNWLDRAGNYHNGALVTERYTRMGENHLWYEATIEDPSVFARPWSLAMPLYRRVEPNAETFEYSCIEIAEPLLYGEFLSDPLR